MKVALYKDLSDSCEYVDVEAGKTIKDTFPEIDFAKRIIVINGEYSNEDHIIAETDLIVIRSIPMGLSLMGWEILGVALLTAGAIAGSIYLGIKVQKMQEELEKAQAEASSSTVSDNVINNPCLAGASNSIATGKTQPYVIGRNLYTPLVMNKGNGKASGNYKGYHSVTGARGTTIFFNTVLECGFNNQYIEKLSADDVTIKQFNDVEAQNGVYPITGNSIFATNQSFCEIRQDGNLFTKDCFNKRVIEETKGDELKKNYVDGYEDLFYTLNQNSQAANICITLPQGLRAYSTAGAKVPRTINITPYFSYDYAQLVAEGDENANENATWTEFHFTKESVNEDTVTYKAFYSYTGLMPQKYGYNPKSAGDDNRRAFLRSVINSWNLESGDYDLRTYSGFEIAEYTYPKSAYGDWTITLSYTSVAVNTAAEAVTSFTDTTLVESYYNANCVFDYDSVKDLQYPVTLKLVDTSVDPDTLSAISQSIDTVNVAWVQSILYDPDTSATAGEFVDDLIVDTKERALSTLLGVHLESTTANEEKLGQINVITNGYARTWNGSEWSTTKTPTSNVASWVLEVLTSDTHKPSQVDIDTEIDLDSFGAWYEYCEPDSTKSENPYGCSVNMVLTDGVTKQSILEDLCALGNAQLYQNIYGKIAVAIDCKKDTSIALLNSQNLISLETERDISRRVDGIKCTYTDASEGFVENTYLVMKDGKTRDDDSVITSQTIKGITDYNQIIRYARREMAVEELRPDVITATVGMEGIFYTPLSKVLLQHASLRIGLGHAEIKAVILNDAGTQITALELYEPIEYDSTNTDGYGIICQCVSSTYCTTLEMAYTADSDGRVTTINLSTPVSVDATVIPHAHDIISYGYLDDGEFDLISSPYLITGIAKGEDSVKLTLVDYNEAIYEDGTIPEYTPHLTVPSTPLTGSSTSTSELIDQIQEAKADAITNAIPTAITQYWAASISNTTGPTVYSTDPASDIATMTETLRYLWNYTIYSYADGTTKVTTPAVIGVYGAKGESGSGYRLDLSPEQQSMLNTTIDTTGETFQIKASFFNDDEDLHTTATFTATIGGTTVGTWEDTDDGKIVTIPCTALSTVKDITTIVIVAVLDDVTRTALATVTKIYSGADAVMYKMLFSATNIKEDEEGTRTPEAITVTKRKVNANGESDTNAGYVTVSIDGGDEIVTNKYINQASSDYNAEATYYEAVEPFFLYTDDNKNYVLGNGVNSSAAVVGGVFYK